MIVGLIGPTCVGKTSVSIALAKELSAEIISVDSRQIYREMTIGTAKPTASELAAVPHHFINERSLNDPVTAAQFALEARSRIEGIRSRGKRVLLVGGSTLYLHALLFGLDEVPASNTAVRVALQARLEAEGLPKLVEELSEKDPTTYAQVDPANPRRVLRALEVLETTGVPLSAFKKGNSVPLQARMFVLNRERTDLYHRIDTRVDAMIAAGLVDEAKVILESGASKDVQALQTIGYREVFNFLSSEIDQETMISLIKRNTRRYAKRQLTWFRRYETARGIEIKEEESVESVVRRLQTDHSDESVLVTRVVDPIF